MTRISPSGHEAGNAALRARLHPYTSSPKGPANAAASLIALDVALGLGGYYDIGALYSDERASADFYYRLLNAGFRIAATGGTDNFSDTERDAFRAAVDRALAVYETLSAEAGK